ncbi:Csu type fimbrial protein [Pseudomonas sp. PWP3-1b2]|uniref:Csu type fimbrial protein n=1 Tax=Pseudomonas sp. PWP3-1b2 TaxID=2804656 RepID=UPI003CEAA67C
MVSRALAVLAMSSALLLSPSARGAVASGFIQASMVITASCEVTKNIETAPVGPTGGTAMLYFGSQGPTWTNTLAAGLSATDNAPLSVACNPTVASFTVTIDGGTNAAGTTRRLSNGRQMIPYQLMADPLGRIPYSIDQQHSFFASDGKQMTIPVWGAVVANTTALPAGIYTDTLTVTLDW